MKELLIQLNKNTSKKQFEKAKLAYARKYHLSKTPKTIEIFASSKRLKHAALISKPIRTAAGVAPVAIMTAPRNCPHGTCVFCPGGPDSFFGDVPQSYTGNEPASRRAARNNYNAYLQVLNRLEHYYLLNQDFSKTELIIMGGTFPSYPLQYQTEFVRDALQAMNDFSLNICEQKDPDSSFKELFELPADVKDAARTNRLHEKFLKMKKNSSLQIEQLKNETSSVRCVALVIETEPDWCMQLHINQMLALGTTRVELGVQTTNEKALKATNRGHSIIDTIKATQLLKDSFLKTTYHMMLGLPETTEDIDIKSFKDLFSSPDYQPDSLKIYPCRVFPGTPLYLLWKQNKYTPLSMEETVSRLKKVKQLVPKYVRIMRIQRDIPDYLSEAGPSQTNIRQLLNIQCNCIRCHEPRDKKVSWKDVKILTTEYQASQGTEIFISAEDTKNDIILGFCRLRITSEPFRPEITKDSAGIRELHVYGAATEIGSHESSKIQHRGLGLQLLKKAEEIAVNKFDKKKMVIISGIGVREYYRKHNYELEGPYMVKKLN